MVYLPGCIDGKSIEPQHARTTECAAEKRLPQECRWRKMNQVRAQAAQTRLPGLRIEHRREP